MGDFLSILFFIGSTLAAITLILNRNRLSKLINTYIKLKKDIKKLKHPNGNSDASD